MTSLINASDLLTHALELAKVGRWEFDLRTNSLFWSKEVFRIHEVDPSVVPCVDQAIHFYTPESRPLIQAAVSKGIESGTPWDLELKLITAKGNAIWVRAIGQAGRGCAARERGEIPYPF